MFLLQDIELYARRLLHNEYPALADLFNYMRRYWITIVTPERFSVYRDHRRTNNDVEASNRQINDRMGSTHLNIWDFISRSIIR